MSTTTIVTHATVPTPYHMSGTARKSQRSVSSPIATRGKPLIFTAMTTVPQQETHPHPPSVYRQPQPPPQNAYPSPPHVSYPSPPAEYHARPPVTMHQQQFNSSTASLPRYRNTPVNGPPLPPSRTTTVQTPRMELPLHHASHDRPQTPPRVRHPDTHHKTTPARTSSDAPTSVNGHSSRRLTKHRPTTPVSIDQEVRPASSHQGHGQPEVKYYADDPFAKVEGVKLIAPSGSPAQIQRKVLPSPAKEKEKDLEVLPPMEVTTSSPQKDDVKLEDEPRPVTPPPDVAVPPRAPPTPPSEEYRRTRRGHVLEKSPPQELASLPVIEDRPAEPFPLDIFLIQPGILSILLPYLSFYEWLVLASVTKKIRHVLTAKGDDEELREAVLERFLMTVGYSRWVWSNHDPLVLTLEVCDTLLSMA